MHKDLCYSVIGCAMKVHRQLGAGFPEIVYGRALGIELAAKKLEFVAEQEKDIYYDGAWVGTRRVDLIIEDKLIVELKATSELDPVHFVQLRNYIEVFAMESGLLVNFGKMSLEYKTVYGRK